MKQKIKQVLKKVINQLICLTNLPQVKQVLIEMNDDFHEQTEQCHFLLSKAGLVLKEKRHSDYIASNTHGFQNSCNQIWSRD